MTKHTPGPWKVVLTGAAQQASIAVVGNGKIIYEFPMSIIDEQPEHLANAYLNAAGPAMLAALEEAVSEMRDWHPDHPSMVQIQNAIAKAEGSGE